MFEQMKFLTKIMALETAVSLYFSISSHEYY
jgi:hypothetical protein